jgi:hypothetical protein
MANYLFLRIDISGDGVITLREFKRSLFGVLSAVLQEDEDSFLAPLIEELQM